MECKGCSLDAQKYNPFNLLLCDANRVEVAYARPGHARVTIEALPEGVSVLANDRIGSPEFPSNNSGR